MTQIKATLLTGGNHIETVSFPCSDDEIMRLTEQNEIGHKATVFINNLIGPKGLKSIEGTYANIHELNYLAKRMDSFDGTEMGKLLAAASRFDTRDLKQLINYTFNLGRITLIQNISDMQTVGVEHYMDIHGGCCSNEEYRDPKRAEEGRALLNSKRGIWTDYGLMFINDEVPWEEVYNGITFPEYLCGGPEESSVAICHGGRTEFVYPPCEQSSIEFALERLGADSLDDCHIQMSCSRFGKPLSEVMDYILNDEGLEAFNEVCHAAAKIPDRDLDKFTAAVLYHRALRYKVDAKTGEIIYNRRYIYMEIARETALKDSGCSEVGKVVFTAEELVDGGIKTPYYQFIFNDGRTQWTYRIDAVLGGILSKNEEPLFIPLQKAKEIALADAEISGLEKAVFTKEELSRNQGRPCGVLEFYTAKYQYSYKVDAKTGEIIYNRRYIYMEIARETALKDSGCSDVGKVVFTAEELVDGGIKTPYYQFIFNDGRTQWTYRIDAISGTILDKAQKLMVCRT